MRILNTFVAVLLSVFGVSVSALSQTIAARWIARDDNDDHLTYSVSSPSAAPTPAEEAAARRSAASEEHVVVVRIFDRADNVGTAKVVVRAGAR